MAAASPNLKSATIGGVSASAKSAAATSSTGMGGPAVSEAVVVGGGLAGLALAIGLRSIGIDAQVYEARSEVGGGEGTIISLFPNGLRALNRIDPAIVPQACELIPLGVSDPTSLLLSPSGDVIAPWGYSATMTARYGLPMLSIRWRDVLDVLLGMLPNDAVHTGHRLEEITQKEAAGEGSNGEGNDSEGTVECYFRTVSCGNEHLVRVETPLLLGADGIHSQVRKHLLGREEGRNGSNEVAWEGVGPRDNGRTIWRAIIDSTLASHPLLKPRHIFALVGPGRTATISDAAAGRLYWAFTLVDSADPTVSSSRSSGGEEAREKILRAFEGWDAVTHLAQVTPPELILERRVLDLPPLPFWVKGRAALLGDAAHAVTPALGQGANLAFEDAAQLVECLRAHSGLSDALLAFQSIRMPRVQAVASQNIASSKKIYDGAEGGGRESDSSSKGIEAMPGESAGAATTGEPASAATPAEPAGAAASIAAGSVTGGKGGGGDGSDFYDYLYTFDTVSLTESAAGR
ncbi:hypothetical protein CLOP_g21371 [Closterium sp. NIES-67]|nr:hypothetical protein CLOP_g21371 [Closterium sp. NIES-67]